MKTELHYNYLLWVHPLLTARIRSEKRLAERRNMAFLGTLVRAGRGRGIVTATADKTEFGIVFRMVEVRVTTIFALLLNILAIECFVIYMELSQSHFFPRRSKTPRPRSSSAWTSWESSCPSSPLLWSGWSCLWVCCKVATWWRCLQSASVCECLRLSLADPQGGGRHSRGPADCRYGHSCSRCYAHGKAVRLSTSLSFLDKPRTQMHHT